MPADLCSAQLTAAFFGSCGVGKPCSATAIRATGARGTATGAGMSATAVPITPSMLIEGSDEAGTARLATRCTGRVCFTNARHHVFAAVQCNGTRMWMLQYMSV